MKPLLVFVHGSADLYGSDKVLLNLVASLPADAPWQPLVVLHEDGPLRPMLQALGVEVHVCEVAKISRRLFTLAAPLRLLFQLQRASACLDRAVGGRPVGLVYSNTLAVLGGAWWAHRRGWRHLWHVHEIIERPALVAWALPQLARFGAHRVIANSRQTQAWLLSRAPGLAARTAVVFNGLGPLPELQSDAVADFRARVGARPGDCVATVAGRLNGWKGQGLLIEAVSLLQRQRRLGALRVAIVGDAVAGNEQWRESLERQIAHHGLQDRVRLLPFTADIFAVWRGTDIAVVPSTDPEPFGMVAIEAMACSVPVVAAAHGGLLDIVEHEHSGLLFRPRSAQALADALHRLASDAALRALLGREGAVRQVARFSLRAQAAATWAVCVQASSP